MEENIKDHELRSLERIQVIEERIDKLQGGMETTHRMLRELSSLVHRHLQMSVSRNKHRHLSENRSPIGYHTHSNGPPLTTLSGLEALRLVPLETPEVVSDAMEAFNAAASKPKPLDTNLNKQTEETGKSGQAPTRLQRCIAKILELVKTNSIKSLPFDDDRVSRRFSVSSINLTRNSGPLKKRKNTLFPERASGDASVSPEEILSARNLEGEMNSFTLRHNSTYRTVWDIFVVVIIVLDLVFTPLSLGFDYKSKFLARYNVLEPIVFTIDFFVRMFSSYVNDHGDLISGPTKTARHYLLSGWAIPDFLSWFPFDSLANFSHSHALGFSKILHLTKVSNLAYKLHSAKKAGFVRFLLLLGIVLTVSHLLTCYWNFVAVVWKSHLSEGAFVPTTLFEKYSLSWSLVIGCINASPPVMYTPIELISVACFMLVGNIIQASVFGAVAALISSLDENEAAFSKKIIATSERCRFLGIPERLAKRIRGYYENLWRETKSISADADAFINELSPALICEVKFQLYRDMLRRIPFLSANTLAPAVIEVLILHLRTVIYMQDDVLTRKGEFGDWMGFIGSKGSVGVLDPNSDTVQIVCILRKGDYFGEMALLQHTKRSATTVALTWVQIHVLCRQDLDYVKEMYPNQSKTLEREITKYKYMTSEVEHW